MPVAFEPLRELGLNAGLAAVGVTTADPFTEVRVDLEDRRARGLHAGMQFTYRNPARSTDPSRTLASGRRLVVGAYDFRRRRPSRPCGAAARVAAYACEDHYSALRAALGVIADHLRADGHLGLVLADENNLVDRAAALRAGLGWWGKSSNILVPGAGSMVLLGSVLTDAEIDGAVAPVADGCGSCTECLTGCPTGAIIAPGTIDANRCLAWLLQAEGPFPVEYRSTLGDRIYGCDDCQDVCPPNRVLLRRPAPEGGDGSWVDIVAMLNLNDTELMRRHGRWYVPRRAAKYLRRNALVVLGNVGRADDPEVRRVVADALGHPDPLVRSHAVWAARRLGLVGLLEGLVDDSDPAVQLELARP